MKAIWIQDQIISKGIGKIEREKRKLKKNITEKIDDHFYTNAIL